MTSVRDAIRGAPLRIALIATLAFTVAYVLVAVAAVAAVWSSSVGAVDQSLYGFQQQVQVQAQVGGVITLQGRTQLVAWEGNDQGQIRAAHGTPYAQPPPLPTGVPTTASVGGTPFRLLKFPVSNVDMTWVVIGESLVPTYSYTLRVAGVAVFVAPFMLALVFFGAWWIGRSAAAPAIRARQRELAFTADASHELRTPLQVIEAESSLALLRERPAEAYRSTIERISGESKRLRSIVDDLLWLARVEEERPAPGEVAPVDVAGVVRTTEERFASVAGRRDITLVGHVIPSDTPPLVLGSVEWLERLAGVLVDNAIRYTPDGGHIDLWTGFRSGRVVLGVADSGPGVTPEQAQHIFERFHRATDTPGGAGLGLAIADSVVRGTGGQWAVGRSQSLGGAQFEVSWPAARAPRQVEAPAAVSTPQTPAPERTGISRGS
ncbi:MAG: HAMP domain-containing histidine kinase [Candidatus Dormibacteraeota bacterium]|nr:HAMP domain-containing histidine kinase [Candidatus Dormibacteraeota bacterium]